MALVILDGREYVPQIDIEEITDEKIKNCISELMAIQYFDIKHKNRAFAWNALNFLIPNLAELCAQSEQLAYDLVHGHEKYDYEDIDFSDNGNKTYTPIVIIDKIKYMPKENLNLSNYPKQIIKCLQILTSIQYFNEEHKIKNQALEALFCLDKELAQLCLDNVTKAYDSIKED